MPFVRGSRIRTQKSGLGACHPTFSAKWRKRRRESRSGGCGREPRFDQSRGRKRLRTVFHVCSWRWRAHEREPPERLPQLQSGQLERMTGNPEVIKTTAVGMRDNWRYKLGLIPLILFSAELQPTRETIET